MLSLRLKAGTRKYKGNSLRTAGAGIRNYKGNSLRTAGQKYKTYQNINNKALNLRAFSFIMPLSGDDNHNSIANNFINKSMFLVDTARPKPAQIMF
jgi:hypothetical protein